MKLTYFDFYGRAESIRMMLAYCKFDFIDNRIQRSEFAALKPNLEYGQLPILEVEGRTLSQSNAILRFLGQEYGMYPRDNIDQAYQIDSQMDLCDDLFNAIVRANFTEDQDLKNKMFKQVIAVNLPQILKALEKRLLSNESKVRAVGSTISIADFKWAGFAFSFVYNDQNPSQTTFQQVVANFPTTQGYFQALGQDLMDYLATRPHSQF